MMTSLVLIVLALMAATTAFRFQRFTLGIARAMVDRGAVPDYPVPAIQKVMSPAWLGMVLFGGYVLAAASAFVGFMELGWWWIVVVLLLTFFGAGLFSVIWPFP